MLRLTYTFLLLIFSVSSYALGAGFQCPSMTLGELLSPQVFDKFVQQATSNQPAIRYFANQKEVNQEAFVAEFKTLPTSLDLERRLIPLMGIMDTFTENPPSSVFCQYDVARGFYVTIK